MHSYLVLIFSGSNTANLSFATQLPSNIFMGLSELFIMAASFEFAYFASRRSTHSLFMSLRFCSIGVSSFIGWIYMTIFAETGTLLDFKVSVRSDKFLSSRAFFVFQCLKDVPNQPRSFYTYFFVLASFQLIFIVMFILCYKKFRLVKSSLEKAEGEEPTEDE